MTGRDRLVLIGVIAIAVVGVVWLMFVSPERKKASQAASAVAAAEAQLASAHSELVTARAAQAKYAASYGSIVHLGKAVPTTQEVPSLMYELAQAAKKKSVEFTSISSANAGTGPSGSASTPASSAAASSSSGGFQQMPFTFVFSGTYSGLEHLLRQMSNFATKTRTGALKVNGRLLTVDGVALQPLVEQGKPKANPHLTATVTATAYVLPPEQASTATAGAGGATPPSTGSSSSGSGSSTTSSSAPPAVIGAKP